MRKTIILGAIAAMFAVTLPSQAAAPQWVFVKHGDYASSVYVDRNSIRRTGAIVRSWRRVDYLSHPNFKLLKILWEDNCMTGQNRLLQATSYPLNGPSITDNGPTPGQFVVPDSVGQSAHDYVCGRPLTR